MSILVLKFTTNQSRGTKMLVHLFQDLQVLSSESQPEKVTSDLPEDPAIIKAIFLHSSSASSITPQATTTSRPNSSSLGLPNLAVHQTLSSYQPTQNSTSFSSLLSRNTLAAGQPMLLHGQEFGRSTGEVPYPQQSYWLDCRPVWLHIILSNQCNIL